MTQDLVQVFEELVESTPGADAFHLRLDDDFADHDVSDEELDERFEDFKKDMLAAVRVVTEAWGSPTFEGEADNDDFPQWSEALVLAYWQQRGDVAYIALRHDDDHSPMFIEVGALTEDEISTLLVTR